MQHEAMVDLFHGQLPGMGVALERDERLGADSENRFKLKPRPKRNKALQRELDRPDDP